MIVYKQDGKDYVLMANSARGIMKIGTDELEQSSGLSERVSGGGTAGQGYETIESLTDIVQLDKLNDTHAIVMVQPKGEPASLRSIELP